MPTDQAPLGPVGTPAPEPAPGPRASFRVEELTRAFESFTSATRSLEREYRALRERVRELGRELEEKNRLLAASLARERRLEQAVLRQGRLAAMGKMAAMLAHEVRNPLGTMELFVGLLLHDLRSQPQPLRLARHIAGAIADLNHLVANLLEFTRTRTPVRRRVSVGAIVDEALAYTSDLLAASGVEVDKHMSSPLPAAAADPDLLRHVLQNLVRNAAQAMAGGGRLTIRVGPAGQRGELLRIAVADTGPGIPPERREAIFEPFYTTRERGTGLGLAVARTLVEAMGGQLEVDSELGKGSVFSVLLPALGYG